MDEEHKYIVLFDKDDGNPKNMPKDPTIRHLPGLRGAHKYMKPSPLQGPKNIKRPAIYGVLGQVVEIDKFNNRISIVLIASSMTYVDELPEGEKLTVLSLNWERAKSLDPKQKYMTVDPSNYKIHRFLTDEQLGKNFFAAIL